MKRLDRLTALLIHLQAKKVVKAQDLADRFDISLRTVYRDIRSLEEAGVPIAAEAGLGYSIIEGYHLPPVMFSKDEAAAFLLAEKVMEKNTDPHTNDRYKSALYKIKAVLRSGEKDFLDDAEENVKVIKKNIPAGALNENQSLQDILYSAQGKKVVAMTYQSFQSDEITRRCVEPIGILLQDNRWYLLAYCRLRQDYRSFRIDRIIEFKVTDEAFAHVHPTLKEYLEQSAQEQQFEKIVVRVDKYIAKYINIQKHYFGFIAEKETGQQVEMTFLSASREGFARWYLMFADHAEIVQPKDLKNVVRSILAGIAEKI